jgi:transcription initiation factor TFIIB
MLPRPSHDPPSDDSSEDNSTHSECPECAGSLTTTGPETICEECGLVVTEHRVDPGPEWRSFSDDTAPRARTGPPLTTTRHDHGLSTEIGWHRDANGTQLSPQKQRQLARLRREHSRGRWQSKAERNLMHGLSEIQRLTSALDLAASITEQACALFRTAHSKDLAQGRSLDALAAASVHATCRCNGLARSVDELTTAANCDHTSLWNAYTTLNDDLNLPTQPLRPRAVLPQLLSAFDLPPSVHEAAHEIASLAEETDLANGANPRGVAGGCLLVALDEWDGQLTQAEVAAIAEVTPTTLRAHRDALQDVRDPS